TPLHTAVRNIRPAIVELLLAVDGIVVNSQQNGRTPLHDAITAGSEEMVRLLLRDRRAQLNQFEINESDRHGRTPLYLAASLDQMHTTRLLLGHGEVDINASSAFGETPLHVAAKKGYEGVVRLLLER
ncbi:ankyrin, partial [Tuber magnatum]